VDEEDEGKGMVSTECPVAVGAACGRANGNVMAIEPEWEPGLGAVFDMAFVVVLYFINLSSILKIL